MTSFPLELTDEDMIAALPATERATEATSPEGKRMRATLTKGLVHLVAKELAAAVRKGYRGRSGGDVTEFYESSYSGDGAAAAIANDYGRPARRNLWRFGDRYIAQAEGRLMVRYWTLRGIDILKSLDDIETLCEVGCGHGRNLLAIANHLPNVRCTGFELTEAGAAIARDLQKLDLPNTEYGKLYSVAPGGMVNVRETVFRQASAFKLPVEDNSFDIVTTFAALEQMQLQLPRALSEVRRVTRKYALLYEPFADVNPPLQQMYLWSRNYFRMPIADLRKHGLEPVQVWNRIPAKPTFAYAFVLCRKI